jgi:hypothetical protein
MRKQLHCANDLINVTSAPHWQITGYLTVNLRHERIAKSGRTDDYGAVPGYLGLGIWVSR